MERTCVEGAFTEYGVVAPIGIFTVPEDGDQVLNCRYTEFGITGMRRLSDNVEIDHQRAFLRAGELILRRLTDDNEFRIPLECVRGLRADAVGLLTNKKQIAEIDDAAAAKSEKKEKPGAD